MLMRHPKPATFKLPLGRSDTATLSTESDEVIDSEQNPSKFFASRSGNRLVER